jgi:hypothetical protein
VVSVRGPDVDRVGKDQQKHNRYPGLNLEVCSWINPLSRSQGVGRAIDASWKQKQIGEGAWSFSWRIIETASLFSQVIRTLCQFSFMHSFFLGFGYWSQVIVDY